MEGESVDELAERHAVARRTLERRFRDETGISFGMWRQKARLLDSIRLLAEGKSVTDAALESGYSSVSAFIAAFKSTFEYTPGGCKYALRSAISAREFVFADVPRRGHYERASLGAR
jgi:AraC-like DNA-binding protein